LWATQGIVADYELLTQQTDVIKNGDLVTYVDPVMGTRTFRVKGTRGQRMGQGSIESYWKVPVKELSFS
jgi:hypothetical protein